MIGILALLGTFAVAGSAPAQPAPAAALLGPARLYDAGDVLAAASVEPGPGRMGTDEGAKDPRLAMLYSLILPGLGEMWLGHTTRAKLFFAAEAGIWTTYAVFRHEGNHKKDLYREYASVFAGVPTRDDDEFYRVIGNYESSDGPFSANELVRREARALYPNDRQKQEEYLQENGYFGDQSWQWESADALARYKEMRRGSLDAYNHADLSIGLAVANRLISVVDAGMLGAKHRKRASDGSSSLGWNLDAGRDGPGASLTLERTF